MDWDPTLVVFYTDGLGRWFGVIDWAVGMMPLLLLIAAILLWVGVGKGPPSDKGPPPFSPKNPAWAYDENYYSDKAPPVFASTPLDKLDRKNRSNNRKWKENERKLKRNERKWKKIKRSKRIWKGNEKKMKGTWNETKGIEKEIKGKWGGMKEKWKKSKEIKGKWKENERKIKGNERNMKGNERKCMSLHFAHRSNLTDIRSTWLWEINY